MIKSYKYFALLITLIANINLPAIASDSYTNKGFKDDIVRTTPNDISRYKFSLGLELFPYTYTERNVMEYKGLFYGISGASAIYLGRDDFLQLEGRYAIGKTSYTSNEAGSFGTKAPNKIMEVRGLYKRNFQVNQKVDLYPFIGFGYRYKEDDSQDIVSTTGHVGVIRKSYYRYIPIGLSMSYNLQKGWNIYASGEYDIFLNGTQKTFFLLGSITHRQTKGYGLRSEILLEKTFNKYIFSIGPYINYWNIKDSARDPSIIFDRYVICYTKEPKNTTKEVGIKIKFTF